jgi:hypothetical protein
MRSVKSTFDLACQGENFSVEKFIVWGITYLQIRQSPDQQPMVLTRADQSAGSQWIFLSETAHPLAAPIVDGLQFLSFT